MKSYRLLAAVICCLLALAAPAQHTQFRSQNRVSFDPAKLSSARAWYEADRISAFSSGSTLQTWTDATTLANSATQATSGSRPTMQTRGGVKVVRFGGAHHMVIPAGVSMNVRASCIYAVVYPNIRHVTASEAYVTFGPLTGVAHTLFDRLSSYNFWNGGITAFGSGPAAGDPIPYVPSNYVGKVGGSDKYGPSVLMIQGGASNTLLRVNGADFTAAALASTTYTGGSIGQFNGATYLSGDEYAVGIFDTPSNADRDAVYSYLLTKYGYTYTTQNCVVTLGDSLTQGVNATSQLNEYPSQLVGLLNTDGKAYQLYNDARSGARITHVSARLAYYVTPKYNASRTKNVAVLWIGSNDISNSVTGSTAYTDLSAVISTLKATGWAVAVCTMLPRTDVTSTKETERGNFNTAIVGNAAAANYVVNLGTVTNLQTPSNTTYFAADGIHLTDAGYALVAQAVHDAVGAGF